jgi:hypothetical protein
LRAGSWLANNWETMMQYLANHWNSDHTLISLYILAIMRFLLHGADYNPVSQFGTHHQPAAVPMRGIARHRQTDTSASLMLLLQMLSVFIMLKRAVRTCRC